MNSITAFLGNILKSGVFGLGGIEDQANTALKDYIGEDLGQGDADSSRQFWKETITILARMADWLIPVIMIIIGMVGAIYFTVIGIKYAKADGEEQKNEAKKKLINAGIGVGISLLIMLVLLIILNNAQSIKDFIMQKSGNTTTQTDK